MVSFEHFYSLPSSFIGKGSYDMYFCAFFNIQINRLHLLELLPVYNFTLLHLKHYLILYVHYCWVRFRILRVWVWLTDFSTGCSVWKKSERNGWRTETVNILSYVAKAKMQLRVDSLFLEIVNKFLSFKIIYHLSSTFWLYWHFVKYVPFQFCSHFILTVFKWNTL